jgi:hypothetical protein
MYTRSLTLQDTLCDPEHLYSMSFEHSLHSNLGKLACPSPSKAELHELGPQEMESWPFVQFKCFYETNFNASSSLNLVFLGIFSE